MKRLHFLPRSPALVRARWTRRAPIMTGSATRGVAGVAPGFAGSAPGTAHLWATRDRGGHALRVTPVSGGVAPSSRGFASVSDFVARKVRERIIDSLKEKFVEEEAGAEGVAGGRPAPYHVGGGGGLGYRAAQELTSIGGGGGGGGGEESSASPSPSPSPSSSSSSPARPRSQPASAYSSGPDALGTPGGVDEATASVADFNDTAHYEKRLLGVYRRTDEMRQKRAGAMEVCLLVVWASMSWLGVERLTERASERRSGYFGPHDLFFSSHLISSHFISSHLISSHPNHPIPPHPIRPHPIPPHHIPPHHIPSHPITSHPTPSHHTPSHHITSHHIPPHHISPHATTPQSARAIDPFALVAADVSRMNVSIKELLGSDHPLLESVARYFFENEGGKKVRPTMVLLMSAASNAHAEARGLDLIGRAAGAGAAPGREGEAVTVLSSQLRLSEITEMIHTASLLHDDVIDMADSRRGVRSVNQVFGSEFSCPLFLLLLLLLLMLLLVVVVVLLLLLVVVILLVLLLLLLPLFLISPPPPHRQTRDPRR